MASETCPFRSERILQCCVRVNRAVVSFSPNGLGKIFRECYKNFLTALSHPLPVSAVTHANSRHGTVDTYFTGNHAFPFIPFFASS